MRAAWYERTGPAREVLVVGEMPDPEPGPGEVRVKLATSGVNPSDWKARTGSRPMIAPRVIPHSDGAGVIDKVGDGVPPARVGERVWVWNGQWKRPFGTCATMIAVPGAQAVKLADDVSFEAGACFGIPLLTAYRALTTDGSVAGKRVLVTGGAGSVGHYAIQLARLLGAAQILTTISSEEKAQHARAAGADAAINYKTEDVVERTKLRLDRRAEGFEACQVRSREPLLNIQCLLVRPLDGLGRVLRGIDRLLADARQTEKVGQRVVHQAGRRGLSSPKRRGRFDLALRDDGPSSHDEGG